MIFYLTLCLSSILITDFVSLFHWFLDFSSKFKMVGRGFLIVTLVGSFLGSSAFAGRSRWPITYLGDDTVIWDYQARGQKEGFGFGEGRKIQMVLKVLKPLQIISLEQGESTLAVSSQCYIRSSLRIPGERLVEAFSFVTELPISRIGTILDEMSVSKLRELSLSILYSQYPLNSMSLICQNLPVYKEQVTLGQLNKALGDAVRVELRALSQPGHAKTETVEILKQSKNSGRSYVLFHQRLSLLGYWFYEKLSSTHYRPQLTLIPPKEEVYAPAFLVNSHCQLVLPFLKSDLPPYLTRAPVPAIEYGALYWIGRREVKALGQVYFWLENHGGKGPKSLIFSCQRLSEVTSILELEMALGGAMEFLSSQESKPYQSPPRTFREWLIRLIEKNQEPKAYLF